jgi:hypothetical protein
LIQAVQEKRLSKNRHQFLKNLRIHSSSEIRFRFDATPAKGEKAVGKRKRRENGKRQHGLCLVWAGYQPGEFRQRGTRHLQHLWGVQTDAVP